MIRKIVKVDEDKCDGCGACVTSCSEGALQIIDGKARIVKDMFCDGFGDCIGECPTGALTIEEREADEFDVEATKEHVLKERGEEGLKQFISAGEEHGIDMGSKSESAMKPMGGGCPGSRMMMKQSAAEKKPAGSPTGTMQAIPSDLEQWPVQLHLVNPDAPYFKDKELVILSTCSPVASADIHWRFLRGRAVVVACPKLDRTEPYVQKLAMIFSQMKNPKISVVRMEVPCCGGLSRFALEAREMCKRDDIVIEEVVVGVDGMIHPPREI